MSAEEKRIFEYSRLIEIKKEQINVLIDEIATLSAKIQWIKCGV